MANFPVIIDACVLVQAAVRDTLLRLAERRLFICRWTDEIIDEVVGVLKNRLQRSPEQIEHLTSELRTYFADAWVESGYKLLVPAMSNDLKDRHVLAAAVKGGCEVIVTYNIRHFPKEALAPLDVEAMTPDEFLLGLYFLSPEIVVHELHEQGAALKEKKSLAQVLASLEICQCQKFAALIREKHNLST
jgi:predicted nucleic acid-binding protein